MIFIIFAVLRTSLSEINVAISRTAQQSSNFLNNSWLAKQVVDGCVQTNIGSNCCSHTLATGHKTAWWRVDLGELITINAITIYYRDNSQYRLAGYELYVTNITSSPQDGFLCYHDNSSTGAAVQLTITHQCPYVGQYVTVYNFRNNPKRYDWYDDFAVLELCEVQVWGCRVRTYGDGNCDSMCSGNCYGGNCNATTGACFYCFTGSYGDFCNKTCPLSCKKFTACEKDSGNCYDCLAQKHGVQCEHDCSVDCKDRLCDKDSGHCYECIAGRYGATCESNCDGNCKDKCEQVTENCIECIIGKHGAQCELNCPVHCKDKCDKVTGNCQECVAGMYGATCDVNCEDSCKDKCEKVTGNCIECIDGRYGIICEQNCPINCEICEKETGQCIVCIPGKFDTLCSSTCAVTCKNFECDQRTGKCLECYPGKYGIVCGADCPESCKEGICNKENGHCLTTGDAKDTTITVLAVVCGLLVVIIVGIIVVVIYLRLKKEKRKNSTDKNTDQSDQDTGYTSIDQRQVDPPHIYEMTVTPHE